jgi:protein TonB
MVGALEIPVPALRIRMEIGGPAVPPQAAPVAQPFRPSATRPRLINEEEVQVVGRQELGRVLRQDAEPRAERERIDQPHFTPMSVQPYMTNRPEVARALLEAYPPELRDRGVGGTTVLQLRVGAEGRVLERRVQKSSGYAAMDEAALRVVDLMRFQPARNRDQRVPVWVSQRATFVPASVTSDLTDHHARP